MYNWHKQCARTSNLKAGAAENFCVESERRTLNRTVWKRDALLHLKKKKNLDRSFPHGSLDVSHKVEVRYCTLFTFILLRISIVRLVGKYKYLKRYDLCHKPQPEHTLEHQKPIFHPPASVSWNRSNPPKAPHTPSTQRQVSILDSTNLIRDPEIYSASVRRHGAELQAIKQSSKWKSYGGDIADSSIARRVHNFN